MWPTTRENELRDLRSLISSSSTVILVNCIIRWTPRFPKMAQVTHEFWWIHCGHYLCAVQYIAKYKSTQCNAEHIKECNDKDLGTPNSFSLQTRGNSCRSHDFAHQASSLDNKYIEHPMQRVTSIVIDWPRFKVIWTRTECATGTTVKMICTLCSANSCNEQRSEAQQWSDKSSAPCLNHISSNTFEASFLNL
jgi:hypothetical protein